MKNARKFGEILSGGPEPRKNLGKMTYKGR